jgi:hypothetical protein
VVWFTETPSANGPAVGTFGASAFAGVFDSIVTDANKSIIRKIVDIFVFF